MFQHSDFLIIGGGVIGLSIAHALAGSGASVTVLDAQKPGQASRAAAGMLAPIAEGSGPGPFVDLGIQSLRAYPDWIAQLNAETNGTLKIVGPGMLRGARTMSERETLSQAFAWQQNLGLPISWLEHDELLALEPSLSPSFQCATLSPEEKHVTPKQLLELLTSACQQRSVSLISQAVTGIKTSDEQITTVETSEDTYEGDQVIICGGAWSNHIARLFRHLSIPVGPVRGQVVSLGPAIPNLLTHTVYTHGCYVVPRTDRRIVIGATEEPNAEFHCETTQSGIDSLLWSARGMIPGLSDVPFESAWAGLRPVSIDGLPILGALPGWRNAHIATGHGRNGILLSPITAKIMSDNLLDGTLIPPPLAASRFTEALCAPTPR